MKNVQTIDNINYIKRKLKCDNCGRAAVTYEFMAEDIPTGFLEPGARVLIGDNSRDIVPAVYLRSCNNSLYPHFAVDDEGELQGRRVIKVVWGVEEL